MCVYVCVCMQTFVGAKVVRLLLTNRDMLHHWRGPIMCVCLTNHALDQFLCDLLDAGVEHIVRFDNNGTRRGMGNMLAYVAGPLRRKP